MLRNKELDQMSDSELASYIAKLRALEASHPGARDPLNGSRQLQLTRAAAEQGPLDSIAIGAGRILDKGAAGLEQLWNKGRAALFEPEQTMAGLVTGQPQTPARARLAEMAREEADKDRYYSALKGERPVATFAGEALPMMLTPAMRTVGGAAAAGAVPGLLSYGDVGDRALAAGVGAVGGAAGQWVGNKAAQLGTRALALGNDGLNAIAGVVTDAGRARSVGTALRNTAADPDVAVAALAKPPKYVVGVEPTSAQASQDFGLAGLERALRNRPEAAAAFAERDLANNAAHMGMLRGLAAQPGDEAALIASRDAWAGPTLQSIFGKAKQFDSDSIVQMIDGMVKGSKSPMERGGLNKLRAELAGEGSAAKAYEVRKLADDIFAADSPNAGALARQYNASIAKVKDAISAKLDEATRGEFTRRYLVPYINKSEPINQVQQLRSIVDHMDATKNVDKLGNPLMTQAGMRNAINQSERVTRFPSLNQSQTAELGDLMKSIARNEFPLTAGRATGSPTVQNLNADRMLGGLTNLAGGGGLLGRAANFVTKPFTDDLQAKLLAGALSPQEARSMMLLAAQNQGLGAWTHALEDAGANSGGLLGAAMLRRLSEREKRLPPPR